MITAEVMEDITIALAFIIPACFVATLVFIYYSREQKTRLFQAQVEAEAKAFETREKMLQFVDDMAKQYNSQLKRLIEWLAIKYGIDGAEATKIYGGWHPDVSEHRHDLFR